MSSFVVVAIFKNETTNLKEWLDHYIWQGATMFYLLDNGSTDNPELLLQNYIDNGLVQLFKNAARWIQISYYKEIVSKIQEIDPNLRPDWVIVADLDEFWFSTQGILKDALQKIPEAYSVVYCNWREFGPSEDGFHPTSLRKDLLYRNPETTSPKYCFRTTRINAQDLECHHIENVTPDVCILNPESIILHHYYCQSEEYWKSVKIPRGYALGDLFFYANSLYDEFRKRSAVCTMYDSTLADLVKKFEQNTT